MNKMHKTLFWSVLVSEIGHVFCCVLPVLLSLLSLFSVFGTMSLVPGIIWDTHHFMHQWELLIISLSAVFLAIGWAIALYLQKEAQETHNHCTENHCAGTAVKRTKLVLWVATGLFAFNFSLYAMVHRDNAPFHAELAGSADHHDHSDHASHGHAHIH